jgi:photosystem II stability/assembly factor-like uncharacterized protein
MGAALLAGASFLWTSAGPRPSDARFADAPVPAWEIQDSGTQAGLRGISAVDENVAWAGGSQGTVLRTVDGGRTWQLRPVPGMDRTDFRDIEAFSADTAVIMGIGRPAKIFRTSDGGATWTETFSNDAAGIFLDAIAFVDEHKGWGLGDPMDGRFYLISTTDGGRTWQELPPDRRPAAQNGESAFAASGTCLAVSGAGDFRFCTGGTVSRIFHTADAGKTWSVSPSGLLSGEASFGAFGIAFLDAGIGLVVGGDYKNEPASARNAAVTADGGKTWRTVEAKPPAGFRECAVFVPGTSPVLALPVGPSGSDYSLDAGRTWSPVPGPAGFHSLSITRSGRRGWAVGKGGLIARFGI